MVEPPIEIVTRTPEGGEARSTITAPTELARLGVTLRHLSQDLASTIEDSGARSRATQIHARAVRQVSDAISGPLSEELGSLGVLDLPDDASPGELRLATAQLLGWLTGLFEHLELTMGVAQDAA